MTACKYTCILKARGSRQLISKFNDFGAYIPGPKLKEEPKIHIASSTQKNMQYVLNTSIQTYRYIHAVYFEISCLLPLVCIHKHYTHHKYARNIHTLMPTCARASTLKLAECFLNSYVPLPCFGYLHAGM